MEIFEEQIKDCIRAVCESGKFNVNMDEFDIDVSFKVTYHRTNGELYGYTIPLVIENEYDLTYKTKLIEKNGKFSSAIYSNVDPKYIAYYAVSGYVNSRDRYNKRQEEKEQENLEQLNKENKPSLFKRLFRGKHK